MRRQSYVVFFVMLVLLFICVQYANKSGQDRVMDDINVIGTDAHTAAMVATWEDNDYWNHPQSIVHALVKDVEIHEVRHTSDLRHDVAKVLLGGQIYAVITGRDKHKEGEFVDLWIELKYEPVSKHRGRTIWIVEEMVIDGEKGVIR